MQMQQQMNMQQNMGGIQVPTVHQAATIIELPCAASRPLVQRIRSCKLGGAHCYPPLLYLCPPLLYLCPVLL